MEADPLLLPLVQDLTEPPYHFLVVLLMEGTLGLLLGEFAEGFGASDLGDGVLKFKYLGLLVLQLGHPVGQLHLELPYLERLRPPPAQPSPLPPGPHPSTFALHFCPVSEQICKLSPARTHSRVLFVGSLLAAAE